MSEEGNKQGKNKSKRQKKNFMTKTKNQLCKKLYKCMAK